MYRSANTSTVTMFSTLTPLLRTSRRSELLYARFGNEADKFEACLAMRNKLLDQHTELGWLFACAEKVMVEESTNYRENKRSWSNTTTNCKVHGYTLR